MIELMEEVGNVVASILFGAPDVGVKGAVGALAPAKREMEVEVHSEVYWGIGGLGDWVIVGVGDWGIG